MQMYPDHMYPLPTNQLQLYSTLLHQVSCICGSMADIPRSNGPQSPPLTPVVQLPTAPAQLYIWKHAEIPRSDGPPSPIDTSCTVPYYTRSVVYVEGCRHTKVQWTQSPQLTPVVQLPTAPGQLYIWKHTEIPRSDGPQPPN